MSDPAFLWPPSPSPLEAYGGVSLTEVARARAEMYDRHRLRGEAEIAAAKRLAAAKKGGLR